MTFTKEQNTHHLKIYPEHFGAVLTGVKRAELRKNDRDFKVGDTLHLMETPKGSCSPTGEFVNAVVTHIADVGDWLPGYVLLSIERETGYTAPPAPVVPDLKPIGFLFLSEDGGVTYSSSSWPIEGFNLIGQIYGDVNACRAAMLQGAEPVTAAYKLPSREHFILLCNQFWNWQEADEINAGEEEPRLEWNGSEFTNRVTQALWRMYQASPGNSPAIPDGYALVPVEPTAEMISSGIAAHYERSNIQIHDRPAPGPMECAYVAMLAAAPQQEVK